MVKVLVVGPSPTRSKGGMATVIEEIAKDKMLNAKFDIDIYESYVDGNKLRVCFFRCFPLSSSISRKEIMMFTIYTLLHMVAHLEKDGMFMPQKSGGKK